MWYQTSLLFKYSAVFSVVTVLSLLLGGNVPKIVFFSVGHGCCALVTYKNTSLLFDCGSLKYEDNIADRILKKAYQLNITRFDSVILSHLHSDHLSGYSKLSRFLGTGKVFYSTSRGYFSKSKEEFITGFPRPEMPNTDVELFNDRKLSIRLLTKHAFRSTSENDSSLVCILNYSGFSVLLPGDLESKGLSDFFQAYPDLTAPDVLLWPHHGSTSIDEYNPLSGTEKFVQCRKKSKGYRRKNAVVIEGKDFESDFCRESFLENLARYRQRSGISPDQ